MIGLWVVRFFMSLVLFSVIALLTLFMFGCAKTTDILVSIPCAKIKYPPKPELPIKKINKNSSDSEVMKAYVESFLIDENFINILMSGPCATTNTHTPKRKFD